MSLTPSADRIDAMPGSDAKCREQTLGRYPLCGGSAAIFLFWKPRFTPCVGKPGEDVRVYADDHGKTRDGEARVEPHHRLSRIPRVLLATQTNQCRRKINVRNTEARIEFDRSARRLIRLVVEPETEIGPGKSLVCQIVSRIKWAELKRILRPFRSRVTLPLQASATALVQSATTFELLIANARSKSSKAVTRSRSSNQITNAAIARVVASSLAPETAAWAC